MAKGTKHKADWKETTLQVVIDAKRLYCHSMKIMGNEKVFNPKNDFHNVTLIRISELLLDVYSKTWEANRINVSKEPDMANELLALQRQAIVDAKLLLSLFELAKSQFHLESRKFWNWMNMLVEFGRKLAAWHKSDVSRYGAEEDFENCYGCIRACMTEGNSVRLIRNMDNFVNELRREINESQQLPARAA